MTTEIVPVNEDYFKNKVFELGKIVREGGLVPFLRKRCTALAPTPLMQRLP